MPIVILAKITMVILARNLAKIPLVILTKIPMVILSKVLAKIPIVILFFFFFISHTQTITIDYIYNSLQVTVIVYKEKKEINKKKGRTKSTKIL